MKYNEFLGEVQHRARLSTTEQAVSAVRATLTTLGQRLAGGEAKNLAAQLPAEIGRYLEKAEPAGERFGLDEFFERVSQTEKTDMPVAAHHARAVVFVLGEAVSQGEVDDMRAQLPDEYDPLFESGSEGALTG
jgi:uncharacterized protein (DUF2267 family)